MPARRARVSVNFRKFSPCMAPARRARAGFRKVPPSRTLELLAFDEYINLMPFWYFCFLLPDKASLALWRKKAEVSKRQYSSKANSSNVRDFAVAKNTVPVLRALVRPQRTEHRASACTQKQCSHWTVFKYYQMRMNIRRFNRKLHTA